MIFFKKLVSWPVLPVVLFFILFGFAIFYRSIGFGSFDFQNDEFYHLNTAAGYLETGKFVEWNFLKESSEAGYPRAWPFTWIVAKTFQVFGIGEWQGRLPSLLFGVFTLPLMYFFGYWVSKNHWVALGASYLGAFDQVMIWSSRTLRMYSGFVFLVLLAVYFLYRGFEEKRAPSLFLGIFFFVLSYLFHEEALLLVAGFYFYLLVALAHDYLQTKKLTWSRYSIIFLILSSFIILFLLVNAFVFQVLTKEFFLFRDEPLWNYFVFPFSGLRWFGLGWVFLLMGIFSWNRFEKKKAYLLSLAIPILIFFAFFSSWHANKKYILFLLPFLFILFADGLFFLFQKSLRIKFLVIPAFIVCVVLLGPWPRAHDENKAHHFREAYAYLENQYTLGEPVIIQGPKSYYFRSKDLALFPMKDNGTFRVKDLKSFMLQYPSGWLLWPKYKAYHINGSVKEFADTDLKREKSISEQTNFEIYRW